MISFGIFVMYMLVAMLVTFCSIVASIILKLFAFLGNTLFNLLDDKLTRK